MNANRSSALALGLIQVARDHLASAGDFVASPHLDRAIEVLRRSVLPEDRIDPDLATLVDALPLPRHDPR